MAPIFTGSKFGFGGGAAGPAGSFSASGGTTFSPGNGYKYHVFSHPGSPKPSSYEDFFVVSGEEKSIEVLVVAGGGSGGGGYKGTGGAGGVAYNPSTTVSSGTYSIIIGTGGGAGDKGEDSSAFGITSLGGGAGGPTSSPYTTNTSGGSAGSSGSGPPAVSNSATQPTQPQPVGTINYGNDSGVSSGTNGGYQVGGGGGAGTAGFSVGSPGTNGTGGDGGGGVSFPQFAAPLMPGFFPGPTIVRMGPTQSYYGGGAGGWGYGSSGAGGYGGGGGGGYSSNPGGHPREGIPLLGGAGATGPENVGAPGPTTGGDGIVIVRYLE